MLPEMSIRGLGRLFSLLILLKDTQSLLGRRLILLMKKSR